MNYLSIAALAAAGVSASTNTQLGQQQGWKQCELDGSRCFGMGLRRCYFVSENYVDPNGLLGPSPIMVTLDEGDEAQPLNQDLVNRQEFTVEIPFDLFDDSIHHWSLDLLEVDSGLTLEQSGRDADNEVYYFMFKAEGCMTGQELSFTGSAKSGGLRKKSDRNLNVQVSIGQDPYAA